ncbi:hypothetical protein GW17_00005580 [Ensete ventricosum]|nr:hypothetical protein GW17_00005580 [Ensete ventricosum]
MHSKETHSSSFGCSLSPIIAHLSLDSIIWPDTSRAHRCGTVVDHQLDPRPSKAGESCPATGGHNTLLLLLLRLCPQVTAAGLRVAFGPLEPRTSTAILPCFGWISMACPSFSCKEQPRRVAALVSSYGLHVIIIRSASTVCELVLMLKANAGKSSSHFPALAFAMESDQHFCEQSMG